MPSRFTIFTIASPECIARKVIDTLKELNIDKAVLTYSEDGSINRTSYGCVSLHGKHRKLFVEEQLTIARLGQLRFWNLLEAQYS